MLLTTCPKCAAQFKVQPDQLNVRQGRVMCGRCRHVFNAFESLQRQPDDNTDERIVRDYLEAHPGVAESSQPAPVEASVSAELPEPRGGATLTAQERSPAEDQPAESPPPIALPPTQAPVLTPTYVASDANPLLIGDSAPKHRDGRIWIWGVGLMIFAGLLEGAFYFRSQIVQTYPQSRELFAGVCDVVGCALPWGRDETAMRVESSGLVESPGKPGRILLTASIANRGKTRQDLPAIELRLTDSTDQVLMSRILAPTDYLGRAVTKGESVPPGAEMFISMNLDVGSKSIASGYVLRPFYP
jgi:predicted Zn finger-like uncharacterized protein